MAARILLVEDESAIQKLVSVALTRAGYDVICADDAEQAQRCIEEVLPDLLLLDWMLPGKSGVMLARELRQQKRTAYLPMIMLTARGEECDKVAGLDAGADDYITKPFSSRELTARIRAVLRRLSPQNTEEAVCCGRLTLDPAAHKVAFGDLMLNPGPTEFRLLHFLMTHPERVYTRTQLLDSVWGDHVFIEERTVDVHIRRLRLVLAEAGCGEMVQTVRGAGYRFSSDVADDDVTA